jgi:hypothetical protein
VGRVVGLDGPRVIWLGRMLGSVDFVGFYAILYYLAENGS